MSDILARLQTSNDKGRLLELALQAALREQGFSNVLRQQSGTQFGFDVIAYREGSDGRPEVWKFECKNTANALTASDVAPKLIWHRGRTTLDVFVIVSVAPLGNELRHLLEEHDFPMRIEVWSGVYLEQVLLRSEKACALLGVTVAREPDKDSSDGFPERFLPKQNCHLNVVHKMDPPPAFHYVGIGNTVAKAYSLSGFQLLLAATNRSQSDCLIYSLRMRTLAYANHHRRVVVLEKPKGLHEPTQLVVTPTTHAGSDVDILSGKIWQVGKNAVDVLEVALANQTAPGLYWLQLQARARLGEREVSMSSVVLISHVLGKGEDVLRLKVVGRHYDSPMQRILGAPQKEWKQMKRIASSVRDFIYLGPTPTDVIRDSKDAEWFLRALAVEDLGHGQKQYSTSTDSRIVHSLGIPVEEEIYSVDTTIRRLSGCDEIQGLLVDQITRRG